MSVCIAHRRNTPLMPWYRLVRKSCQRSMQMLPLSSTVFLRYQSIYENVLDHNLHVIFRKWMKGSEKFFRNVPSI